jgi:hypothetical protein
MTVGVDDDHDNAEGSYTDEPGPRRGQRPHPAPADPGFARPMPGQCGGMCVAVTPIRRSR